MFWQKARKIRELKTHVNELTAACNTNKITVRAQDDTIRTLQQELESARNEKEQIKKSAEAEVASLTEQLRLARDELQKSQDKITQLEEDLREKDRVAQAAARRDAFGSLSEMNDYELEKKAAEEPSPGIGDYSSGATHPAEREAPDGEWR